MGNNVPEAVKDLIVLTLDGETIKLTSLWEKRRIVLTFFRHFG